MRKLFFILINLITLSVFSQQQKIGPEFGNLVIRGGLVVNNVPPGSSIDSILTLDSTGLIRFRTAGSITTPTPTFQQTLIAGSTLTQNNTIEAATRNFAINHVGVFEVHSGDQTYVGAISALAVDPSGSAQYSQSAAGIGSRIIASPTKSFMESFNAGDTSYVRVNTDGSIRLYDAGGIFFETMLNTDATKFLTLNASGQLMLVTPSAGTNGTVTSVGLVAPSIFTVSGSPVTVAGNLTLGLATQTAAKVFASPTASTGVPTFRLLAATDIPTLTASKISNFVATVRTSISLTTTGTSGAATYNNSTGVLNIPNYAPGGGGSVTSFSSGNLSPLFTTSVATATTTPALSFTLSNAAANTYFGNNTGGSAAPAFHTFPTIPAQFNLIAGTNITTSGAYPNITVNAAGGGGSGVTTLAAIGASPNANAATISGSTLNLEPASASFGGVITIGAQTFSGAKSWNGVTTFNAAASAFAASSTTILGMITSVNSVGGTNNSTVNAGLYGSSITNTATPANYAGKTIAGVYGTTGSTDAQAGGSATALISGVYGYGYSQYSATTPVTFYGVTGGGQDKYGDGTFYSLYAKAPTSGGNAMAETGALKIDSIATSFVTSGAPYAVRQLGTNMNSFWAANTLIGYNPGTTPHASAKLEISSLTKGFLPPRMTTTQRDAISSPAEGLFIYNSTTNLNNFYNGTAWVSITTGGGGSGTVTSVTATGTDGIGITGSPITTAGTLTFSLGAITPTSVAASGTMSGSNLSGTNTGDQNLDDVVAINGTTIRAVNVGPFTASDASSNLLLSAALVTGSPTIEMGDIDAIGNSTTIKVDDNISRYIFSKRGFDIGGIIWAFPAAQGAANTFLRNDGSGNLTWATTGGGSGTVTSVGLTSSDITVGGTSPITTSGTYTLTLPTVNSNVGTFTHATLTVNAKGQVTAASSGSVPAQFNPIAGLGMTLSGSYPNITFNSTATLDDILGNGNQALSNSALTQGFINTGFQQQHTTTNTTGVAYTVATNDYHVYADANVTLPAPITGTGSSTRILIIQNSKTSGSISVIPPGAEEIHDKGGVTYTNGSPLVLATEDESVTLKSANGLYWVVIARN